MLDRDRDVAERARWLTLTRIPGSLLLAFYNREKPIQSFDVPLLQLQPAGARARSIAHCVYVGFFACFQAISLERSRFRKIAFFSCFRSPQAAGIAHRPPRSLYCENKRSRQTDKQTDRPSTVTLAAHARRGLTTCYEFTVVQIVHKSLVNKIIRLEGKTLSLKVTQTVSVVLHIYSSP